jgi:hypothetical protein
MIKLINKKQNMKLIQDWKRTCTLDITASRKDKPQGKSKYLKRLLQIRSNIKKW